MPGNKVKDPPPAPDLADKSCTATAIIAVCGLVWAALTW